MCYLLALFLCLSLPNYPQIFGEDYQKALAFYQQEKAQIDKTAKRYGLHGRRFFAVAFPELIRYNYFKDFLESGALELRYVDHGPKAADFSIGHFQMKPSFVESLEDYLRLHEKDLAPYLHLSQYPQTDLKQQRQQRLQRLKSSKWQIAYLAAFWAIMEHRTTGRTWTGEEEQFRYFATAYNTGFQRSTSQIELWLNKKAFPYGINYGEGDQYNYADVAWDFFKRR
jgi:hypothetical protein